MKKDIKRFITTDAPGGRWSQPEPPQSVTASRSGKAWTKDEDRVLRLNYTKHGSRYTAALLKRTITSVQSRVLKLGIPGNGLQPWTEMELRYLRKAYGKHSASQIARTLQRTEQSVRGQIHRLKLGSYDPERWTSREIKFLRTHYGKKSKAEIAKELDRTENAVEIKAGRLGLSKPNSRLTPDDVKYIVSNLGAIPYTRIASTLGTTVYTVTKIATQNGYRDRPTSRAWTAEDDLHLRRIYGTMTRKEVASRLDRTWTAIAARASELGLTRSYTPPPTKRPWTADDDQELRRLYSGMTRAEIAEKISRTPVAVAERARRLGLTKRR
ncbi:MAG: hypothetical protein JWQ98_123 [Chlorobi bacterium]|nr:hypothetical protein [Chlorobiota bacterium]